MKSIEINRTVLDNGIVVLSEYVPWVQSFSLGLWVNVGSRDEQGYVPSGTTHFIEHLAFRRTKRKTTQQISSAFERMGAYTNAFTTKENTCFYVRALSAHFRPVFALLAEMTTEMVFQARDVEKERGIIIEEVRSYEDDPEESIHDQGERLLFGDHPLASQITGTEDSVKSVGIEHVTAFYEQYYRAGSMVVTCAGNIDHATIVRQAKKLLGTLDTGSAPVRTQAPTMPSSAVRKQSSEKFQQAHLFIGSILPNLKGPQKFVWSVINTALGDGMSSRLYQKIREKRGLAYTIYSSLQFFTDCGQLSVYAAIDEKNIGKVEKLILTEFDRLAADGLNNTEMYRAKKQAQTAALLSMESMSARMQYLGKSELEDGYQESIEDTMQHIESVHNDEVRQVASATLVEQNRAIQVFDCAEASD